MFTKFFCLTLFIYLISCRVAFPQGAYLERGKNGFDISASYLSSKSASGIGGYVGYSISGIFDINVSFARFSLDQKLDGDDVSVFVFSPGVTLHIIKQDSIGTPISIALSADYERDSYSSTTLDKIRLTVTGEYFSLGVSTYGNVYLSPISYIQPFAGVTYVFGTLEEKDSYGISKSSGYNTRIFHLSVGFVFKTSPTTIFHIRPGIGIDENNTSFSITAGFVFPIVPCQ
jgi:hypothetical protein